MEYVEEKKPNSQACEGTEDEEDTLSFCDFPMYDQDGNEFTSSPRNSTAQELFEFVPCSPSEAVCPKTGEVLFCGKLIPYVPSDEDELNEYQKRDYFSSKSSSYRRSDHLDFDFDADDRSDRSVAKSRSVRFDSAHHHSKCSAASPVQKVNISSLTSMSAKSRRRMFMFGMVKFKPEMDVTAIRERQGRRTPAPVPPATVDEKAVAAVGQKGGPWGLVRTLRCKSHLHSMLAKSFGCIPLT